MLSYAVDFNPQHTGNDSDSSYTFRQYKVEKPCNSIVISVSKICVKLYPDRYYLARRRLIFNVFRSDLDR